MAIQVQGNGGTVGEIDSTHRALRVSHRPIEAAGSFHAGATSGTVAAGASADSIVYSFRNPSSTTRALIRRVQFSVHTLATGFTAGVGLFYLSAVRGFTVADTTGGTAVTLTGNNGKLRTSLGTTVCAAYVANTGAITAGTGTADTTPLVRRAFTFSNAVQTVLADATLIEQSPGEQPLVLAQDEGFRIYATVPATGTWVLNVNVEWDELLNANF